MVFPNSVQEKREKLVKILNYLEQKFPENHRVCRGGGGLVGVAEGLCGVPSIFGCPSGVPHRTPPPWTSIGRGRGV